MSQLRKICYIFFTSLCFKVPIDMIQSFPIDEMHCVYLGVVKRMVDFMMSEPRLPVRIVPQLSIEIGERLSALISSWPSDFQRRPRVLAEYRHWKATERKNFLMYSSLFAMRGLIEVSLWDAWAFLFAAIHMLSRPSPAEAEIAHAERLIQDHHRTAVSNDCFGRRFPTMNSHLLLHLPDSVRRYGALGNFSAFCYENFYGKLKTYRKGRKNVLQEVVSRILEAEKVLPLEMEMGDCGRRILGAIASTKTADRHWMAKVNADIHIIRIRRINWEDGTVLATRFGEVAPAFDTPFDSSFLHCYKVARPARLPAEYFFHQFLCKLVFLHDREVSWVIPLAHTFASREC